MVSHWGVKGKRTIIVISTSTSICILQRAAVTSSRKELVDNEQINPKHYKEAWSSQHSESSFCFNGMPLRTCSSGSLAYNSVSHVMQGLVHACVVPSFV